MSYRSIVVCLDESKQSAARLQFALKFAAAHEAHLTGLHISYLPIEPYMSYGQIEPLFIKFEAEMLAQKEKAREAFLAATTKAGIAADWQATDNQHLHQAFAVARTGDLILIGQHDPEDTATYLGEGFPGRFLLEIGRPALMLPHSAAPAVEFSRVVIAWNGSREAARAVADALPLLLQADTVTVLSAGLGDSTTPGIAAWLRHHGISADILENHSLADPAEWILSRAESIELQADLLVAGAYGHSRLSELILGGVTRTLLKSASLPVLFSH
jgi:nucleotide-binding universal stress UspA family protein